MQYRCAGDTVRDGPAGAGARATTVHPGVDEGGQLGNRHGESLQPTPCRQPQSSTMKQQSVAALLLLESSTMRQQSVTALLLLDGPLDKSLNLLI